MDILQNFLSNLNKIKNNVEGIKTSINDADNSIETISQTILGSMSRANKYMQQVSKSLNTDIIGMNKRYVDFVSDHDEKASLKDRYGDLLDSSCLASISSNNLELFNSLNISSINNNNVNNATCVVQNQTGSGMIKLNNNTSTKNCLDLNTNTFWYEEILSDDIIAPHTTSNNVELTEGGAFCELKIELETIRRANSITIKPMCKFPVYIKYIRYSHTDGIKETLYNITIDNDLLVGNEGVTIQMDTILCKNLYIGLNQVHYSYKDVEYKETDKDYKKLTTHIKTGYLYEYGISYINLTYKDYSTISVYTTKDIYSVSPISKLYIEDAEKTMPYKEDDVIYTDTEYYISSKTDPGIRDWVSVLPMNKSVVECEKLFDLGGMCRLRFVASEIIEIRQNGIPMGKSEYEQKKDTNGIYGVTIFNHNPNITYTVKYKPIESSKYVKFEGTGLPISNSEIIKCNESNVYTLTAYPFNPTGSNVDIDILDTIKNKIYKQSEGKIDNITGSNKFLFNKNKFQYYIDKDKIFFNQNMDEKYIVNIRYKVVDSKYKLKIIMRRNTNKTRDISQSISEIKIYTENY